MKKIVISILLLLSITASADVYDTLPATESGIYNDYSQPSQQEYAQEPEPEYYPTQTDPAPGVMYDYRTPSYDIYNYGLAPQD